MSSQDLLSSYSLRGHRDASCLPLIFILGALGRTAPSPALSSEHFTNKHLPLCRVITPKNKSCWRSRTSKVGWISLSGSVHFHSVHCPFPGHKYRAVTCVSEGCSPLLLPHSCSAPHQGPHSHCQQCNLGIS